MAPALHTELQATEERRELERDLPQAGVHELGFEG